MIPWQLQRDDLLFVPIDPGEKGPRKEGWNLVFNGLQHNDPVLISYLETGWNYGVYPAPGSHILFLDIDNADVFNRAGGKDLIKDTFQYSAWNDWHKCRAVVECENIPVHFFGTKTSIRNSDRDTILELFFPAGTVKKYDADGIAFTQLQTGGQCVAPGSRHPNGNKYTVLNHDADIISIAWEEIETISSFLNPDWQKKPIPKVISPGGDGKTITEKYDLVVTAHLPGKYHLSGCEIRGDHPVHGSTSKGGNVALNPVKNTFYCFRCAAGGDAAMWDAINKGILRCGDPYDNATIRKHLELLNYERPEVRARETYLRKYRLARGKV